MQCAVCGHKNAADARVCASCGSALGLGTPVSSTPGIATGGTDGQGATNTYTPFLPKGIRLQNGAYAIGDVLGQGGFGITYKGGDLSLRRYVAIKEFFPAGCARQDATVQPVGTLSAADYANVKSKFVEEARTLARFNDPGIVRVFGVFEENNTAYMVMEFLEGTTMSSRMDKGPMDEVEAVSIIEKVGNALSVVHTSGLIHRDIKPDNICLTKSGRVVLIDFGTARSFATGKTVKQTTMLTPGYAPLEQYGQQARFGAYTDIYALAATLYHALTGQMPPQATDRAAGVEIKAPREINPRISPEVSDAIVWAMQLKANERPQDVKDFLQALRRPVLRPPTSSVNNSLAPLHNPVPSSGAVDLQIPRDSPLWSPSMQNSSGAVAPGTYAWVQHLAENQLVTNAAPSDVLSATQRAFQASGVANASIDAPAYKVLGTTSGANSPQNVVAAVTQDARGIVVTLTSHATVGYNDVARSHVEVQRLIRAVESQLRGVSASPTYQYATPPPIVVPPIANPYGTPQPQYQRPYQPMLQKRGSSVLTLALLGIFCCGICAPIAWINGNAALAYYGKDDPGDRGTVEAGRILGIVGTVIWGIIVSIQFISAMGSS